MTFEMVNGAGDVGSAGSFSAGRFGVWRSGGSWRRRGVGRGAGRVALMSAVVAGGVVGGVAGVSHAQFAMRLAVEGAPIGPNGTPIGQLLNPNTNGVGGFMVRARVGQLNTQNTALFDDYYIGRYTGGVAPGTLVSEATSPGVEALGLSSFVSLNDVGRFAYSATVTEPGPGGFRETAMVINGSQIGRSGQAFPSGLGYDGKFWGRALGTPRIDNGLNAILSVDVNDSANLTASDTGSVILRRFANGSYTKLLELGQSLGAAGTISPTETGAIGGVQTSRDLSKWATVVDVNSSPSNITGVMVLNGAAATLAGGGFVRSGTLLSAADGGDGVTTIGSIRTPAVNNSGTWSLSTDLDNTPSNADEAIIYNGVVRYREGQTVAGKTLTGLINNNSLNNSGDIAWSFSQTGLFLNDTFIAGQGTTVDTDGDGLGETQLLSFTETLGIALSDRDSAGNVRLFYIARTSNGIDEVLRLKVNLAGSMWVNPAGGAWQTGGNWQGGVPNGAGQRALFTTELSAPSSVSLGSARTLGYAVFASANGYTLTGSSLTLDAGEDGTALLQAQSGAHTITAAVTVSSPLLLETVVSGASLTLTQPVASAFGVQKLGPGVASVQRLNAGKLLVTQGTLRLTSATANAASSVSSLSVAGGAFLDLGGGALAVGSGGGAGDLTTLRAAIANWYAGGGRSGTGIGSSLAGIGGGGLATVGIIPNAIVGSNLAYYNTFGGVAVSGDALLLRYTLYGDTDLSGTVDAVDLANLLEGLNLGLTGWENGDVDYNGVVDRDDLSLLVSALGSSIGGVITGGEGASGVVPEPGALGLLAAVVPVLSRRRRG